MNSQKAKQYFAYQYNTRQNITNHEIAIKKITLETISNEKWNLVYVKINSNTLTTALNIDNTINFGR